MTQCAFAGDDRGQRAPSIGGEAGDRQVCFTLLRIGPNDGWRASAALFRGLTESAPM
jgi:hypothetical protein